MQLKTASLTPTTASWQQRSAPTARFACAAYAVLVVYASLAPWSGWRDLGVSAFAYLTAPWPTHITRFDVIVNVLGYVPFGVFGVLALHPRLPPLRAVLVITTAALVLSGAIEALQTFIPRRIPSTVDLLANTLGALAGALAAARSAPALIDRGRLAELRARWFVRHASVALVLFGLWWVMQIHPVAMLFGSGLGDGWLLDLLHEWEWPLLPLLPPLPPRGAWTASDFVLAEAVVTTAGVLAIGLAGAAVMTAHAPRVRLLLVLIGGALAAKSLAYGVRFGPDWLFAWITPGAVGGLAVGLLALLAASWGPPRAVTRLALLAIVSLLLAVSLVPDNPYFYSWTATWRTGKMTHFNAVGEWIALAWPLALTGWLVILQFRAKFTRSGAAKLGA
jgi:VanZ family protein